LFINLFIYFGGAPVTVRRQGESGKDIGDIERDAQINAFEPAISNMQMLFHMKILLTIAIGPQTIMLIVLSPKKDCFSHTIANMHLFLPRTHVHVHAYVH
jgi:hypothetical protein